MCLTHVFCVVDCHDVALPLPPGVRLVIWDRRDQPIFAVATKHNIPNNVVITSYILPSKIKNKIRKVNVLTFLLTRREKSIVYTL